jgi:hypothetical protein
MNFQSFEPIGRNRVESQKYVKFLAQEEMPLRQKQYTRTGSLSYQTAKPNPSLNEVF